MSKSNTRVWLYTLVAADYDGATMLPHFINYYRSLGIPLRRFLVILHHNSETHQGRRNLDTLLAICHSSAITCRVWEGQFSSEAHYEHMLIMLRDYVYSPYDWVVVADSDELQDWGGGLIKNTLEAVEMENATWVKGYLIDRVSLTGRLTALHETESLFKQYPLTCQVVKRLYRGWTYKVVAFKNYLRSGRANHLIISPDKARAYFGPCSDSSKCPRGRNIDVFNSDLYALTPYSWYSHRYRYKNTSHIVAIYPDKLKRWEAKEYRVPMKIHHFKWHAGVLVSMRERSEYYSGDCILEVHEKNCTPVMLHWKESSKTYNALKLSQRLNITAMNCHLPPPWRDVAIDTTDAGVNTDTYGYDVGAVKTKLQ